MNAGRSASQHGPPPVHSELPRRGRKSKGIDRTLALARVRKPRIDAPEIQVTQEHGGGNSRACFPATTSRCKLQRVPSPPPTHPPSSNLHDGGKGCGEDDHTSKSVKTREEESGADAEGPSTDQNRTGGEDTRARGTNSGRIDGSMKVFSTDRSFMLSSLRWYRQHPLETCRPEPKLSCREWPPIRSIVTHGTEFVKVCSGGTEVAEALRV